MRLRLTLPQLLPVLLLLPLLVSTPTAAVVQTVSDGTPGFQSPRARAAYLGLPVPSDRATQGQATCALDASNSVEDACFSEDADAFDYIAGAPRPGFPKDPQGQTIRLTGTGGTSVNYQSSGYYGHYRILGKTCYYFDCSEGAKWWYSANAAKCTHFYPANDYYRNYAPTYRYLTVNRDFNLEGAAMNCNRSVMYPNSVQGGSGADNCYFNGDYPCGGGVKTYNSVSWHYN